jgi:REP element-mobilizing transposase RayT
MRCADGFPSLRGNRLFPFVRPVLAAGSRAQFRVVHFTAQSNHVHLIVEANGKHALTRGMQGLTIRLAKAINCTLGRGRTSLDRALS